MIKEEKVQKVDQKAREIQSRYASVVSSKKVARRLDELIIGVKRAMYIYISVHGSLGTGNISLQPYPIRNNSSDASFLSVQETNDVITFGRRSKRITVLFVSIRPMCRVCPWFNATSEYSRGE